jgi:membrane fusion protein (multidrug efflux system)
MVLVGGLAWKESKTGEVSAALNAILGAVTGAQAPIKSGAAGGPGGGGPGGGGPTAPGGGGSPGGAGGGGPKGPVGVEVVSAKSGKVQDLVAAVGTLRANQSVVIRPEIAARFSGVANR